MKTLETMTKEERSLLLFLETCAVDNIGRVKTKHMNVNDFIIAEKWNKEKFLYFGRIYSKDITDAGSHWCILTDEAWQLASEERKGRAKRTLDKRTWRFANEINNQIVESSSLGNVTIVSYG